MIKNRRYLFVVLAFIGSVVLFKLFENFFLIDWINDLLNGNGPNELVSLLKRHQSKNPEIRDLAYYQQSISGYVNRILFLVGITALFLAKISENNFEVLRRFFTQRVSKFSVSTFRVVLFIWAIFSFPPQKILKHASMGPDALVMPTALGWLKPFVSFNETLLIVICWVFIIACLFSIIGLFGRKSMIVATVVGLYVMGYPEYFGKVDHYHFAWHTMVMLCFLPTSYIIRLDKLPALLSQKPNNSFNADDIKAGIVVQFILLLLALVYFFPGAWKYIVSGSEWALSDNMMHKMHSKWLEFDQWLPFIRVDRIPFLYKTMGLFTLIFEIGFIYAIFFKKARPLFLITAFSFHIGVHLALNILFVNIMLTYILFVDWQQLYYKLKNKEGQLTKKNIDVLAFNDIYSRNKATFLAGVTLFFFTFVTGCLLINSWPFSVNPTFASLELAKTPALAFKEQESSKWIVPLIEPLNKSNFPSKAKLRAYSEKMIQKDSLTQTDIKNIFKEKPTKKITAYQVMIYTNPDSVNRVAEVVKVIPIVE